MRLAHNPNIGIDVAALVRNKGAHTLGKPIWCSTETREQLRRYIAHERSELDPLRRTRLEQLNDDDPIFLSRRKRQLEYSGFSIVFTRLLGNAQRHFRSAEKGSDPIGPALPAITPHTIRHLHTTYRVKKVGELFATAAERERALEAVVDDLGWRSAEMLKTYDHAVTRSENARSLEVVRVGGACGPPPPEIRVPPSCTARRPVRFARLCHPTTSGVRNHNAFEEGRTEHLARPTIRCSVSTNAIWWDGSERWSRNCMPSASGEVCWLTTSRHSVPGSSVWKQHLFYVKPNEQVINRKAS